MNAKFILDERWLVKALILAGDSIEILECIADLMEIINEKSNSVLLCCADIYEKDCSNQLVCDVLFGELARNSNSRDVLLRLSAMLHAMDKVDVEKDEQINSDALKILKMFGGGALLFNENITTDWWDIRTMMVVDAENKIEKFYRIQAVSDMISFSELTTYLEDLFPSLYFLPEAKDFSRLGVDHKEFLPTIISHLSYLNDHARKHYLENISLFNRTAASHGVDLSGESSNTRANHKAIRERVRSIKQTEITFELHTKITWNKGRIHFHIGNNLPTSVLEITKEKIIIGIVCEHLTT